MDSLLFLAECRSALTEAKDLKDVLDIRDKAERMRSLMKVQGESLAAQNEMAEVTVRAEIAIADAVDAMDKQGRGRPDKTSQLATFTEIGLDRRTVSRWRTMAGCKRKLTALRESATNHGKDFTRAMVYREGKRIKDGDKPARAGKESWGPGEWISHLRQRVETVYDEAPEDFKEIMANVLRTLADNVETWESADDGSSGRNREAAAVA